MKSTKINDFGKTLITNVRDESIYRWKSILNGHMKGDTAKRIRNDIKNITAEEAVQMCIPEIVDTVLFYILNMLESKEDIKMIFTDKKGDEINVNEASDGLAGELYSDEGWIKKYSKY